MQMHVAIILNLLDRLLVQKSTISKSPRVQQQLRFPIALFSEIGPGAWPILFPLPGNAFVGMIAFEFNALPSIAIHDFKSGSGPFENL